MATGGREVANDDGGSGRVNDRLTRAWDILALPLISIALSVLVGSVVIIFSEWLVNGQLQPGLAIDAYAALIEGSVGSERAILDTLVATVPLLLGGLSVGLAFKAGLFNIGAQGQFLMGALGAVAVGAALRESPAVIAIPLSLAAGHGRGGVWGFIPGVLKAVSGAHEVVTTIMLNYVALARPGGAVNGPLTRPGLAVADHRRRRQRGAADHLRRERPHRDHLSRRRWRSLVWWLLYRTTLRLRDPDRRRQPRRRALRRDAAARA